MSTLLTAKATKRQFVDAAVRLAVGDIEDQEAFDALLEAARLHLEALKELDASPPLTVPFGPRRGQPLSALSRGELTSLEKYVTESLRDPAKARFTRSNLELRAGILAQLHRARSCPR